MTIFVKGRQRQYGRGLWHKVWYDARGFRQCGIALVSRVEGVDHMQLLSVALSKRANCGLRGTAVPKHRFPEFPRRASPEESRHRLPCFKIQKFHWGRRTSLRLAMLSNFLPGISTRRI